LLREHGVLLDISFGALDFEHKAVATATDEEIVPGVRLRICSPNATLAPGIDRTTRHEQLRIAVKI